MHLLFIITDIFRIEGTHAGNPFLRPSFLILFLILYLFIFTINIAITVRRLHDINRSGWWFWFGLFPIIGQLIVLYWLVQPSDNAINNYGDVPEK